MAVSPHSSIDREAWKAASRMSICIFVLRDREPTFGHNTSWHFTQIIPGMVRLMDDEMMGATPAGDEAAIWHRADGHRSCTG